MFTSCAHEGFMDYKCERAAYSEGRAGFIYVHAMLLGEQHSG